MNRQTELDGLRAIAILLVIAFHAWFFLQFAMPEKQTFLAFSDALPWIAGFIRRGDVGVDVFFVLSGYLLSLQLFYEFKKNDRLNFLRFYQRRLFRIYPLYIIALALVSVGAGPSLALMGNLFAYNIWFDPFEVIIPWSWSLSVELEYYAIAPLLVLFALNQRRLMFLVLGFCALSVGYSFWVLAAFPQLTRFSIIDLEIAENRTDLTLYYKHLYVSMPVRLAQFILGLAGAWIIAYHSEKFAAFARRYSVLLTVVALAGLAAPLLYNPHGEMANANQLAAFVEMRFGRVVFAFAVALVIMLMQIGQARKLSRVLSAKPLEPIARFSFSMYLFHPLFVYLGITFWVGSDTVSTISFAAYLGVFLTAVVGSMLLGFLTWYGIESPAINFGRRLGNQSKP